MDTPQQQAEIVSSPSEVAAFFEVNRSTVHDWTAKEMPGSAGRYDLGKITRWLFTSGPWKTKQSRDDILEGLLNGR